MQLREYINNLSRDKQFKVAIHLCRLALPIWYKYADNHPLEYRDTVVGMQHKVRRDLLENTLNEVEKYLHSNPIKKLLDGKHTLMEIRMQFDDPIVALQDCDWELPDAVLKTFYTVYNLIEAVLNKEITVFGDRTIYVSVNQAIDALEISKTLDPDEITKILKIYDVN